MTYRQVVRWLRLHPDEAAKIFNQTIVIGPWKVFRTEGDSWAWRKYVPEAKRPACSVSERDGKVIWKCFGQDGEAKDIDTAMTSCDLVLRAAIAEDKDLILVVDWRTREMFGGA